jgi:hypothetical protein
MKALSDERRPCTEARELLGQPRGNDMSILSTTSSPSARATTSKPTPMVRRRSISSTNRRARTRRPTGCRHRTATSYRCFGCTGRKNSRPRSSMARGNPRRSLSAIEVYRCIFWCCHCERSETISRKICARPIGTASSPSGLIAMTDPSEACSQFAVHEVSSVQPGMESLQ